MTNYSQLVSDMINHLAEDLSKIPGVKVTVKAAVIEIDVEGETDDVDDDEREARLSHD